MFLQPKRTKYKKQQKKRIKSNIKNKSLVNLHFGMYGIQALEESKITARQIESVRRSLTNFTKRQIKIWIRVFPNVPITKKPTEIRMGRGKGNIDYWIAKVRKGDILFEVDGKNINLIRAALKNAKVKLPLHTKIVQKYEDLI